MKTLYNIIKLSAGILLVSSLMVSCIPEPESMDKGQTLIKLTSPTEDGYLMYAIDGASYSQTVKVLDIRRDFANTEALNSSTTVVLEFDKADTSMLNKYNDTYGTEFVPFPEGTYSINPPISSGNITLEFKPGEFAKEIYVTIPDATTLMEYAYAFAIKVTVSGEGKWSEQSNDTLAIQIMPKNKYDGIYEVKAVSPMIDVVNSALTGLYPFKYVLETSGLHSCRCFDSEIWFDYMHPIMSGTDTSGYGYFGLEVFFDPSGDGTIIDLKNPWGNPPGNTRMPVLDPSGVNKWDPATHDIRIKYWMIQPSVVTTPPHIRTYFDELWIYKGPR